MNLKMIEMIRYRQEYRLTLQWAKELKESVDRVFEKIDPKGGYNES